MTRNTLVALIVVGAALVGFGSTLSYGFVWDDHFLIGGNPLVRQWSALPRIFASHFWAGLAEWKMYYRPLINATYLADYQVWGDNPFGYHLTNLIVHVGASLAVLWVSTMLLGDWLAALMAALLFTLHPVHSQSVSFVAGRTDLLSALFFLLAIGLYHRWRESARRVFYLGAAGAFLLALLSKEVAATLPAVLVAYEWAFARRPGVRHFLGRAASGVGPLLVPLAAVLVARHVVLGGLLAPRAPGPLELGPRILTTLELTSWYAWTTIVPYPASPSQSATAIGTILDLRFLAALAGLVPLVAATLAAAWRWRVVFFFATWFWLTLSPSVGLNLVPGTLPVASDRFLYLPSVGVCVLVALGFRRLLGEVRDVRSQDLPRLPTLAFGGVVVAFSLLTMWRNEDWKDDLRLFYRMADTDPQSLVAAVNLGIMHLRRLEAPESAKYLERAIALAPNNSRALVSYGVLRAETGHVDEGLGYALRGLSAEPAEGSLHALVGRIYLIKGDFEAASLEYREATRLLPQLAPHYFALAFCLLRAGQREEAVRAFDQGVDVARTMQWAHFTVDRLGGELFADVDPARAIRYWERYRDAIRQRPTQGEWEASEIETAEREIRKLRARVG
jgi:tetratricopeptide (TPR) repeat protein